MSSLFQCLSALLEEKCFPVSNQNLPCCNIKARWEWNTRWQNHCDIVHFLSGIILEYGIRMEEEVVSSVGLCTDTESGLCQSRLSERSSCKLGSDWPPVLGGVIPRAGGNEETQGSGSGHCSLGLHVIPKGIPQAQAQWTFQWFGPELLGYVCRLCALKIPWNGQKTFSISQIFFHVLT